MKTTEKKESLKNLAMKLKKKYPQLTDSDLKCNAGHKGDMLRIVAYKLRKTKQEMHEIVKTL